MVAADGSSVAGCVGLVRVGEGVGAVDTDGVRADGAVVVIVPRWGKVSSRTKEAFSEEVGGCEQAVGNAAEHGGAVRRTVFGAAFEVVTPNDENRELLGRALSALGPGDGLAAVGGQGVSDHGIEEIDFEESVVAVPMVLRGRDLVGVAALEGPDRGGIGAVVIAADDDVGLSAGNGGEEHLNALSDRVGIGSPVPCFEGLAAVLLEGGHTPFSS